MAALFNRSPLFGAPDRRPRERPSIVLVIGAHREELAFGEAVAEHLDRRRIDVLRIPAGISGRRPGPDELATYRRRHAELYRQILEHVQPEQRVLIDLHTGFDERLCSADILCADPTILHCIEQADARLETPLPAQVRAVRLVGSQGVEDLSCLDGATWPSVRPELPDAVWCGTGPLYVGVEVYLRQLHQGTPAEAHFAVAVIAAISDCALTSIGTTR
jgi:hypothetical protein